MTRPLVVRVGDLLREAGSRRDFTFTVAMDDLSTSAAAIIPGMPVRVSGEARSIVTGVEVVGVVAFDWWGACRRCLDDVTGGVETPFREVCQHDPVDDDILPMAEDMLDMEPLIRELVLSGLPLAPLCRPDCPGPDPERFPALSEVDVEADAEPVADPRWAALGELRFD